MDRVRETYTRSADCEEKIRLTPCSLCFRAHTFVSPEILAVCRVCVGNAAMVPKSTNFEKLGGSTHHQQICVDPPKIRGSADFFASIRSRIEKLTQFFWRQSGCDLENRVIRSGFHGFETRWKDLETLKKTPQEPPQKIFALEFQTSVARGILLHCHALEHTQGGAPKKILTSPPVSSSSSFHLSQSHFRVVILAPVNGSKRPQISMLQLVQLHTDGTTSRRHALPCRDL